MRNHPKVPEISHDDIINSSVTGMKEAVQFVKSSVVPILNGQLQVTQLEDAIRSTFLRIHCLSSSQTRLNNDLDFNAVAINCRTQFELLLDLKLLTTKDLTDKDIKKYYSFVKVDRFRAAKKYLGFLTDFPDSKFETIIDNDFRQNFVSRIDEDELKNEICDLWGESNKGKPKYPDHWSGMSIKERAEKFGAYYIQQYIEIYNILSNYVHSGCGAYYGFSAESLREMFRICLDISRKYYLESLILCSEVFHLSKVIKNFAQVVEFIENAPDRILLSVKLREMKQGS